MHCNILSSDDKIYVNFYQTKHRFVQDIWPFFGNQFHLPDIWLVRYAKSSSSIHKIVENVSNDKYFYYLKNRKN